MLCKNKLLIDQDCPMCKIYGYSFEKIGLLDKDTVKPYQTISDKYVSNIDMERAKTEIALYDTESKITIYGIAALIKIMTNNNSRMMALLNSKLLYLPLSKFYKFISYNRKVIVPVKENNHLRNCTPANNLFYRWLYIIFTAVFTGLILNSLLEHVFSIINIKHHWQQEYLVCFGQILWQAIAINVISRNRFMDYLGNMSSVSFLGGLLLLPLVLLTNIYSFSLSFITAYFFTVVCIMFIEHIRRCRLLEISILMTASWVLFRTVTLLIIIISNNLI